MKLTTEQIVTHPKAFGLTTASPLQRAFCRVGDGVPLGDLAEREDVRLALGGRSAIESLPSEPPAEFHVLAAIRSFKSLYAAARILTLARSVDVSGISAGDIVRIGVVALKVEGTRPVMSHLAANLRTKPLLRPLAVGEPTDQRVVLRHPSGRPIEVSPEPLDRAGGSLVSTWLAGVVLDEAPRMIGASDGVKNFDHARDATAGRILPGGQFLPIGAPWAPFGPIYNAVQEHFGRPSADVVVVRGRGPDLNPYWWTPKRCEALRRRNATAFRTDVMCEFADVEEGLVSAAELDAVTRAAPAELPFDPACAHVAVIDPAAKRNAFVLQVLAIKRRPDGSRLYRVCLSRQWLPRGTALDLEKVWTEIAALIAPFRLRRLATDQFSVEAMRVIARRHGLDLDETTVTATAKLEMFTTLATLVASRDVELAPDPLLRSDLLSVRRRTTQAGVVIHLPTTSDGRHADFASALALGVHVASQTSMPGSAAGLLAHLRRRRPQDEAAATDFSAYGGSGWGAGRGIY